MKASCETCRFFKMAQCLRRAPIISGKMYHDGQPATRATWPSVAKNDWCGEHETEEEHHARRSPPLSSRYAGLRGWVSPPPAEEGLDIPPPARSDDSTAFEEATRKRIVRACADGRSVVLSAPDCQWLMPLLRSRGLLDAMDDGHLLDAMDNALERNARVELGPTETATVARALLQEEELVKHGPVIAVD